MRIIRVDKIDIIGEWIIFYFSFFEPLIHIFAKFFIYKLLIIPFLVWSIIGFYYMNLLLRLDIIESIKDLATLFKCVTFRV